MVGEVFTLITAENITHLSSQFCGSDVYLILSGYSVWLLTKMKKIEILAKVGSYLESMGKNLLPRSFMLLSEFISLQLKNWCPSFLISCQKRVTLSFLWLLFAHDPFQLQNQQWHIIFFFSLNLNLSLSKSNVLGFFITSAKSLPSSAHISVRVNKTWEEGILPILPTTTGDINT